LLTNSFLQIYPQLLGLASHVTRTSGEVPESVDWIELFNMSSVDVVKAAFWATG